MNTEPEEQTKNGSSGCLWVFLILLLLIGGGAFAWWKGYIPDAWLPSFMKAKHEGAAEAGAGGGRRGGRGRRGSGPVPVVVSRAKKGDLAIYLDSLGTVTALNTVTIHTRVDGALDKINFTEGQHVKQGDILAEIDPRPFQAQLAQAQGQLAKDQASLDNSKADLQRYVSAREAVTQQQVDTAKASVAQFTGALKSDQGQVDTAQLQLTYSRVVSPITGRIGLRLVDQGNIVHAADAGGLAVITQLTPITVIFSPPEVSLPQILKAQAGGKEVTVEAYDRDMKNKLATGQLLAVDSQIDPTTGTIRCRASFENKDEALFPNQFVNVRLLVETRKDVVLVPLASLQHSPKEDFVYIVKEDQTVEQRAVTAGTSEGEQLILEKGVNPGEIVITEGVDKLQPGMKVTMPEAGEAGNPHGGKGGKNGKAHDAKAGADKPKDASALTDPKGSRESKGKSTGSPASPQ